MALRPSLAEVRLLASGTLPDRASARPILYSCDTGEDSAAREHPFDPCLQQRLDAWKRLQSSTDPTPPAMHLFSNADAVPDLHSQRLREDWRRLCAETDTPLLVYLHCGHQPDTRSPILQYLLQTLDHHGPVHALRVECRKSLQDAMALARAMTANSSLSLVLRDPTERLTPRPRHTRPLRYALLGTRDRAVDLSQRRAQAAVPLAATPIRSQ